MKGFVYLSYEEGDEPGIATGVVSSTKSVKLSTATKSIEDAIKATEDYLKTLKRVGENGKR